MRVRLNRIDEMDLNVFEFDRDLTLMMFFLDAKENVYARYGGRNPKSPDAYQSLPGLRRTMESVLAMHKAKEKLYAPRLSKKKRFINDYKGSRQNLSFRSCLHCHDVKQVLDNELWRAKKWTSDMAWRYPPPEQVGLSLDVEEGNVIAKVLRKTPAAKAGLRKGDRLKVLNNVPIHSIGDVQFALDRARKKEKVDISWVRNGKPMKGKLVLPKDWEKYDISWRPSLRILIPSLHVAGADLSAKEKKMLGLKPNQLAFRQGKTVHPHAKKAGIRSGDVVVGVDGKKYEMDVTSFLEHFRRFHLVGDRVVINVIRNGKRVDVPMKLIR